MDSPFTQALVAAARFHSLAATASRNGGLWVSAGGGTANVVAGIIARATAVSNPGTHHADGLFFALYMTISQRTSVPSRRIAYIEAIVRCRKIAFCRVGTMTVERGDTIVIVQFITMRYCKMATESNHWLGREGDYGKSEVLRRYASMLQARGTAYDDGLWAIVKAADRLGLRIEHTGWMEVDVYDRWEHPVLSVFQPYSDIDKFYYEA